MLVVGFLIFTNVVIYSYLLVALWLNAASCSMDKVAVSSKFPAHLCSAMMQSLRYFLFHKPTLALLAECSINKMAVSSKFPVHFRLQLSWNAGSPGMSNSEQLQHIYVFFSIILPQILCGTHCLLSTTTDHTTIILDLDNGQTWTDHEVTGVPSSNESYFLDNKCGQFL